MIYGSFKLELQLLINPQKEEFVLPDAALLSRMIEFEAVPHVPSDIKKHLDYLHRSLLYHSY